eukprot:8114364-Heterocapsa_arctica.AAC.2
MRCSVGMSLHPCSVAHLSIASPESCLGLRPTSEHSALSHCCFVVNGLSAQFGCHLPLPNAM